MIKEQVLDLIRQGESQTTEFKEKVIDAKDLAKEMVAFANTNDGFILVGVHDNKTVVGIKWGPKKDEWIVNIGSNSCHPPVVPIVDKVDVNNKLVVVLTILEGQLKPYKAGNVAYIRVGPSVRPASSDEEAKLMQEGGHISFERLPVRNALWEDLNLPKINDYLSRRAPNLVEAPEKEKKKVLRNLEFLTNGVEGLIPNNAAVLCFGEYPQKFIIQSSIKCAFFKGTKKTDFIADRSLVEGSLEDLIEKGTSFVGKNMRVARVREEERGEIPQYSLRAVQEALANAISHRDYTIYGRETIVMMFDDRLEIESPGGLAGGLIPENLGRLRYSRNPLLTRFLYEMGLVEGLGTGIELMRQKTTEIGAPEPEFVVEKDSFKVIFRPAEVKSYSYAN